MGEFILHLHELGNKPDNGRDQIPAVPDLEATWR
jgi:hypothetical protein